MATSRTPPIRLALELLVRGAILITVARAHPFSYDVHGYWRRMHGLSMHHLPYRDFLWEFPPLTVLVVLPARWLSQSAFTAVFAAEMVAAEYGTLLVLRRHAGAAADSLGVYWTAVALPLAAQAWFRLDFLSALLATWALVALLRRRGAPAGRGAATAVTLGYLAKLWPAMLVILAVWQRRSRTAVTAVAGVVATTAVWIAYSPAGFRAFLRYRHGSGFQIESAIGAVVFAAGAKVSVVSDSIAVRAGQFGWVDPLLLAAWSCLAVGCVIAGLRHQVNAVALLGGLVIWLMLLSRILSPQYLVWALPFAALCWVQGERLGAGLFAAAAWLTTLINWQYQDLVSGNAAMKAVLLLRNVLLVGAGLELLRVGLSDRARDPATQPA